MSLVTEIIKGLKFRFGAKIDTSPMAAITTVRPPLGNEFLPTEA
jgi:hypothetical protein